MNHITYESAVWVFEFRLFVVKKEKKGIFSWVIDDERRQFSQKRQGKDELKYATRPVLYSLYTVQKVFI